MIVDNTKILFFAWLSVVVFATASFAAPFPPFQTAVTELSGSVSFVGESDISREGSVNEVWSPGETLHVGKGKNFFVKVAVSDLALVSFDSGAIVKLVEKVDGTTAPAEFHIESGSCFFRTQKSNTTKLVFQVSDLTIMMTTCAGYLSLKDDTFQAICGSGTLEVVTSDGKESVGKGYGYKYSPSRGLGSVKTLPGEMLKKLGKAFRQRLADKTVPVLEDMVPPHVTIVAPKDGTSVDGETVLVAGVVDDPSVSQVHLRVDGSSRGFYKVSSGRFNFEVKLYQQRNSISVGAEDESRRAGVDSVTVTSLSPGQKPEGPTPEKVLTLSEKFMVKVAEAKKLVANPANPGVFIVLVIGAGILIFVGIVIVKKIISASKTSIQKASELATGIVFDRCQKCTDREYQYHLFYTTETVNSPFLRNMINNVNPMATSMMNESLESLLSTGLKWSQKAKQAQNKLRVICRWCDTCKTGTLSLEHMEGEEVVKVDDYQIIHPIFIEWVRKVYD